MTGAVDSATLAGQDVWKDIEEKAGVDVLEGYNACLSSTPGAASCSPNGKVLPTEKDVLSDKRVVLYRDVNGWCPFCTKVWMALAEKGIEFDTIFIDFFNKPEWYPEVASNGQTPAMRLDGKNLCESFDIMMALEEAFPDTTPLLPKDAATRDAIMDFCKWVSDTPDSNMKVFEKVLSSEKEVEIEAYLDKVEETKAKVSAKSNGSATSGKGPHLFGDFSLADIMVAPFLPMLLDSNRAALNLSQHPHTQKAMLALQDKESFRISSCDNWTRFRVLGFFIQGPKVPAVDVSTFSERDMKDRREAAAKLAVRRAALVNRMAEKSGVMHKPGSVYGVSAADEHGGQGKAYANEVQKVIEDAIQRVCVILLTGEVGKSSVDPEGVAIQAASIAYLRNVGCSPRDMSFGAINQMRDACDVLMQRLYEFPEPERMAAIQKRVRDRIAARKAKEEAEGNRAAVSAGGKEE